MQTFLRGNCILATSTTQRTHMRLWCISHIIHGQCNVWPASERSIQAYVTYCPDLLSAGEAVHSIIVSPPRDKISYMEVRNCNFDLLCACYMTRSHHYVYEYLKLESLPISWKLWIARSCNSRYSVSAGRAPNTIPLHCKGSTPFFASFLKRTTM